MQWKTRNRGLQDHIQGQKRREHEEFVAWQDSFATSGDDSSDGEGSAESNDMESDFKRKMALCLTSAK